MANQGLNIAGKYQRFHFLLNLVSLVYCYGAKHREITKKHFYSNSLPFPVILLSKVTASKLAQHILLRIDF